MRTLLVVDDEVTVADAIGDVLRKAGYTTLTANDGAEALRVIGAQHVDLVLTDLVMTGMDGATLIRWLRSDPATAEMPVILMSMLSEERAFALCSDYSRFVRKPLHFDSLFKSIEELCDPTTAPAGDAPLAGLTGFLH